MRAPRAIIDSILKITAYVLDNPVLGDDLQADTRLVEAWAQDELTGENERKEAAARPLDPSDWSVRAWRLFEELGKIKYWGMRPKTLGDVRALNPADLLKVRGCGRKTLKEISNALDDAGIGWPKDRHGRLLLSTVVSDAFGVRELKRD